jgi:hypothetical protein
VVSGLLFYWWCKRIQALRNSEFASEIRLEAGSSSHA